MIAVGWQGVCKAMRISMYPAGTGRIYVESQICKSTNQSLRVSPDDSDLASKQLVVSKQFVFESPDRTHDRIFPWDSSLVMGLSDDRRFPNMMLYGVLYLAGGAIHYGEEPFMGNLVQTKPQHLCTWWIFLWRNRPCLCLIFGNPFSHAIFGADSIAIRNSSHEGWSHYPKRLTYRILQERPWVSSNKLRSFQDPSMRLISDWSFWGHLSSWLSNIPCWHKWCSAYVYVYLYAYVYALHCRYMYVHKHVLLYEERKIYSKYSPNKVCT